MRGFTHRTVAATDNALFLRAFSYAVLYLRSVLSLATGMIWKPKLDHATPLWLNLSVTPCCLEDKIYNHHHAPESLLDLASAHLDNCFLKHTHSLPVI